MRRWSRSRCCIRKRLPRRQLENRLVLSCMRGSRGGAGGPDPHPLENHKNIGFLSNAGPSPLENHKATKPAFNVGP